MNTVWKFPLEITDMQKIKMPVGAVVVHGGLDPFGVPCLWCQVDDQEYISRYEVIYIVGTGNPIPPDASRHLGSFVQGPFVWHVYC